MEPGLHWYVVHTYSGHEQKVADALKQRLEAFGLKDQITDILVPTQEKIVIDAQYVQDRVGALA
ncbi:MAG: transcription termination/antitermination NusG family protein, partial [Patescibacteria group bacterium]